MLTLSSEHAQKNYRGPWPCVHTLIEHAQQNGVNTFPKMAAIASSPGSDKHKMAAFQLSGRLQQCWTVDINWDLYPAMIKEVN